MPTVTMAADKIRAIAPPNRLRELRTVRNWTLKTVARKTKLDESTISYIERRLRNPGPRARYRFAKAFGVPEDVLFPEHEAVVAS
jgi:transcriptional regulator with XRE-family HTH domain